MPNLLNERVIKSKPFESVGIDYCGLINVKEKNLVSIDCIIYMHDSKSGTFRNSVRFISK